MLALAMAETKCHRLLLLLLLLLLRFLLERV